MDGAVKGTCNLSGAEECAAPEGVVCGNDV
jgi:hypothetical protein